MPQYNGIQSNPLKYKHISTAGTTVVKATPGVLANVIINSGTTNGALTLLDQSTTITTTNTIAAIALGGTVVTPDVNAYNLETNVGLVVVSAGTIDATILFS